MLMEEVVPEFLGGGVGRGVVAGGETRDTAIVDQPARGEERHADGCDDDCVPSEGIEPGGRGTQQAVLSR
jgi:hypothetical protein